MAKSKNQKLTVQVAVTVPEGTSKTKVEKSLSTLLKAGVEGFKLGAPKVLAPAATAPAEACPTLA